MILLYAAIALLCIHYLGSMRYLPFPELKNRILSGDHPEFNRLAWWVGINLIFYMVIPLLITRFWLKEPPLSLGFSRSGNQNLRIYFIFFSIMLPLVFAVSFSKGFQDKYPYYELNSGEKLYPWFWIWELIYLFQFIGLEYFFRGFMVLGLKEKFGLQSILIMTIPYCMIHFSKPMPEAVGSIFAGLALGYLSYKKGSVLPGAFLHFSVAVTMDLLALWQKGFI